MYRVIRGSIHMRACAHTRIRILQKRGTTGTFAKVAGEKLLRCLRTRHTIRYTLSSQRHREHPNHLLNSGFGVVDRPFLLFRVSEPKRYRLSASTAAAFFETAHQRATTRKNPPRSRSSSGDSGFGRVTRSVTWPGPPPTVGRRGDRVGGRLMGSGSARRWRRHPNRYPEEGCQDPSYPHPHRGCRCCRRHRYFHRWVVGW